MPKVSVILAIYNVAPYLKRSLDCLINQTLKDIEIICIDDCSTDNSLDILTEYAKKDNRIFIITSKKNNGAAIARNKGLQVARGEYLGFIDPDDAIDLNYYERLYNTAKENNLDVVKCNIKSIFPDGKEEVGKLNDEIKKNNISYLFNYEWTTAIYRASFVYENNISFPDECIKAQDDVFLARIIFKHATLKVIDDVYYYYYKRENSLDAATIPMRSIKSALTSTGLVLKEINNSNLNKTNPELYMKLYINRLCTVFRTLFQNDTFDAKLICSEALINYYFKCLDLDNLSKNFPFPWIIKYINTKDTIELAKYLSKYKRFTDIRKPLKWYQKILSTRNDVDCKILYLFGFQIKLKRKK